jgi:hypothetical protein
MARLDVDESYLARPATKQGQAAAAAHDAAWASAGHNISQNAFALAAKLRMARQTYAAVDGESSGNLDRQMFER